MRSELCAVRVDGHVQRLSAALDAACGARRWDDVAVLAGQLDAMLPPRLGLLARAVVDFVREGEPELAAQLWAHLRDALDDPPLRG
jgi:hypothetical protein